MTGRTITQRLPAVTDVARDITRGGLAGVVGGVLVVGVGGRLAMRLSAVLANPRVDGFATENGNVVGEITLSGTIELIVFAGLFGGLVAGVVWVLIRPWLVRLTRFRAFAAGIAAAAIGGFTVIEADNQDFFVLRPPGLHVALFVILLMVLGAVVAGLDRWLDKRLPSSNVWLAPYLAIAALGAPFVGLAFANFFLEGFCFCESPPIATGIFMVLALVASAGWWIDRLRSGERVEPRKWMSIGGRLALFGAVLAGAIHLAGIVSDIV